MQCTPDAFFSRNDRVLCSELVDKYAWQRMDMAHTFSTTPDQVRRRDTVERVSALHTTCKDFIARYERLYKPVVITDLQMDWPAREKWTLHV